VVECHGLKAVVAYSPSVPGGLLLTAHRLSVVSVDGLDSEADAPGPIASALLAAVAGLLLLFLAGFLVTDRAFVVAGPLTSLLVVAVVTLWVRDYL
jgi:hypothetical protein